MTLGAWRLLDSQKWLGRNDLPLHQELVIVSSSRQHITPVTFVVVFLSRRELGSVLKTDPLSQFSPRNLFFAHYMKPQPLRATIHYLPLTKKIS